MECEPVEGGYNDSVPELKSQARQPFRKRRHSMCKLRERLNPALTCDSALVRVQCSQSLANVRPAPHLATQPNQMQMPIPLSTQMSTQYQMQMRNPYSPVYTHTTPESPNSPLTYTILNPIEHEILCIVDEVYVKIVRSRVTSQFMRCELRCLSWMERRERGAANGYGR